VDSTTHLADLKRREKSLVPAGIRTPVRPARSLLTILTKLSRFNSPMKYNICIFNKETGLLNTGPSSFKPKRERTEARKTTTQKQFVLSTKSDLRETGSHTFSDAFAKRRIETISFVLSVGWSVRKEQLDSHCAHFHEISYRRIFRQSVEKIKFY
jgi:hypothetical protein